MENNEVYYRGVNLTDIPTEYRSDAIKRLDDLLKDTRRRGPAREVYLQKLKTLQAMNADEAKKTYFSHIKYKVNGDRIHDN